MVRIVKFKKSTSNDGKEFISLKVAGGIEAIQSQTTGRFYLTERSAYIATTFCEETATALIGTTIPGTVKRVSCDPYDYNPKDSDEIITLDYKYEYMPEVEAVPHFQQAPEESAFLSPMEA